MKCLFFVQERLFQKDVLIMIGVMLLLISCGGGGGSSSGGGGGGGRVAQPPPSCDCPGVSGSDTAVGGSSAGSTVTVETGTCMEPRPCSDVNDLSVSSYDRDDLTPAQESDLAALGAVYALLEIEPNDKTWDPAIQVIVELIRPAPRDNFELTIFRWVSNEWDDEGTAIADSFGDTDAEGEIRHTSLFAFVDTTEDGDIVVIPDIIGLPLEEVAQIFAEAGLEIGQIEEIMMEAQAGTVIDTDPVIGSEVEPGTVVNVVITTPPDPPTANFTIVDNGSFEYSFVNQSTNAETYFWDFGDGTFSEEMNPTHTYNVTSEGTYTFNVVLTVSGPGGEDEIVKVISFIYIG